MPSRALQAALYLARKRKRIEQNPIQSGPIVCSFLSGSKSVVRAPQSGSFITDGFTPGVQVKIEGALNAENNGLFSIVSVGAAFLTVSQTPVDEFGTTGVRVSRVLAG